MFGKRQTSSIASANERFDTLIGKTSEIHGRIVVSESLRIDGKVVGNIESPPNSTVTIAICYSCEFVGDIFSNLFLVAGKFEVNIY